jgi:hypothetical protein
MVVPVGRAGESVIVGVATGFLARGPGRVVFLSVLGPTSTQIRRMLSKKKDQPVTIASGREDVPTSLSGSHHQNKQCVPKLPPLPADTI